MSTMNLTIFLIADGILHFLVAYFLLTRFEEYFDKRFNKLSGDIQQVKTAQRASKKRENIMKVALKNLKKGFEKGKNK